MKGVFWNVKFSGNCYFCTLMTRESTVAFHTLGCKLNFAETSTIGRQLQAAGYKKVSFSDTADVYVINTCSVTENADRECRQHVNRALTANPEGCVIIIGCYAQLKPDAIATIPGVSLVLGASEKFNIPHYLQKLKKQTEAQVFSCDIADHHQFTSSYSEGDRTRVFLKVQDGCDYGCTFCTIPLARGASRSNTIENVIENVKQIVDRGAKEIVLTGVNLGDFGKLPGEKKHATEFFQLVSALDALDADIRFRISSIEPNLLTEEIIELVSCSKKFMPHFHIPLQSGSDKILKLMRRRYLTSHYTSRINKIKKLMPDACIGVDVITGFPGETEEDFLQTYKYLNEADISYLHVFTYSERANTPAIEMKPVVPVAERKRRTNMLRILSEKKLGIFYRSQEGKTAKVLFEHENKNGIMSGYSENYVRVSTPFNNEMVNKVIECKIGATDNDSHEVNCTILESITA